MYDDGSGNGLSLGSICSFVATRQIQSTVEILTKQLELCSYGLSLGLALAQMFDNSKQFNNMESFVKVDGRKAVKSNDRGFTLPTIEREGNLRQIKKYDTGGSDDACTKLRDYLRSLPNNTQLVGITYGDNQITYDNSSATFHTEVRPVLTEMGVDVSSRDNGSSLCFFVTKGKPELTKQNFAASGHGPATMKCPLICQIR